MSSPPNQPRETSWDYDEDDEDRFDACDGTDDNFERDRCVLGARCLVADPFHSADECFDAEMAEAFFAEEPGHG